MRVLLTVAMVLLLPSVPGAGTRQSDGPAQVQPHRSFRERLESWRLRVRLDFGPEDRPGPGSEPVDAMDWSPYADFTGGIVRAAARTGSRDLFTGDFIEGERALLLVSVDPGRAYRMILTLGDADASRGPVRVSLADRLLADSLHTAPGEFVDVVFDVTPQTSRVGIRIEAAPCATFAANGLAVYAEGPPPTRKPRRDGRVEDAPGGLRADADSLGWRALATLRAYADYLLATQPAEGGFSHNGNWYECAYPVRTLLWATRLTGDPRYRESALACMDRFVAERRPDGYWAAHYFGTHGCPVAMAMVEEGASRNLADVGSLAGCLPLIGEFAPGPRAASYLEASRSYAEAIVLPAQLPSGAFPNGRYEGVEYTHPYSVATAVQATHLGELFVATGDARYRDAALRAGRFLAGTIQSDGSVRMHPHDSAETRFLPAERVGDLFYVLEGILAAHRLAVGAERDSLGLALDRYFRGESMAGLWTDPAGWIRGGDVWERSKRAGILYLLESYRAARGASEDLDGLILEVFGALERPEFARTLGVGSLPGSAQERYAMAATGFAGIGVALLAAPGRAEGSPPGNEAADR